MGLEFHGETDEEREYRKTYLIDQLLRKNKYFTYAKVLENYLVNFTNEPGTTAACDAENGIIYINEAEKYATPAKMSMLIRHELLHGILKHTDREIRSLCQRKGIDYDEMTNEQFDDILKIMHRSDTAMRHYNARTFGNRAGDNDLSRYYLLLDKEEIRKIGGLLIDDHPDWLGLSFEEIMIKCEQADQVLRRRAVRHIHSDLIRDENGNIIGHKPTYTQDSEFRSLKIQKKDIVGVTIPSADDIRELKKDNTAFREVVDQTIWLYDEDLTDEDFHFAWAPGASTPVRSWLSDEYAVAIEILVDNSDLYINAFSKEKPVRCKCLGFDAYSIPGTNKYTGESDYSNKVILIDKPFKSKFNKLGNDNIYDISIVKQKVDEWFKGYKH